MLTSIKTYVVGPQRNRLNVDPDQNPSELRKINIGPFTLLMSLIK